MASTRLHIPVLAWAVAAAACSHGAAGPAPATAPLVWPAPPDAEVARYAGTFPDPRRLLDVPAWRRLVSAVVGTPAPQAVRPPIARPFGVASSPDRDLLIADPDAPAVLRVSWTSGAWSELRCPGEPWKAPMAVAVDGAGAAWIADGGAAAVVRVAPSGGCERVGAGALERPAGVAALDGRVYVVDPPRHQVVAFDGGGREVLRFGDRGTGDGQLNFPTAIAAAGDGTLLVVDALNYRVVRFDRDGRFLGAFGEPGDTIGRFGRPKGIAVDRRGRVFVSDAEFDVVLVFSPEGAFEAVLAGPGSGPGQLVLPAGLAASAGFLYVADSYNRRVQVYALAGETP
jgi:DNA-binding beta-propeller fold protein YncE